MILTLALLAASAQSWVFHCHGDYCNSDVLVSNITVKLNSDTGLLEECHQDTMSSAGVYECRPIPKQRPAMCEKPDGKWKKWHSKHGSTWYQDCVKGRE